MQTLFDATTDAQLISRVEALHKDSQPLWGKMSVAQMLAHCQSFFELYFGELKLKQSIIGRLFGNMAKKRLLTEKPMSKNLPTAKEFIVNDKRDFTIEREKIISWLNRFAKEGKAVSPPIHPFFGQLTAEEWGKLAYKHLDHHLQQFGV